MIAVLDSYYILIVISIGIFDFEILNEVHRSEEMKDELITIKNQYEKSKNITCL